MLVASYFLLGISFVLGGTLADDNEDDAVSLLQTSASMTLGLSGQVGTRGFSNRSGIASRSHVATACLGMCWDAKASWSDKCTWSNCRSCDRCGAPPPVNPKENAEKDGEEHPPRLVKGPKKEVQNDNDDTAACSGICEAKASWSDKCKWPKCMSCGACSPTVAAEQKEEAAEEDEDEKEVEKASHVSAACSSMCGEAKAAWADKCKWPKCTACESCSATQPATQREETQDDEDEGEAQTFHAPVEETQDDEDEGEAQTFHAPVQTKQNEDEKDAEDSITAACPGMCAEAKASWSDRCKWPKCMGCDRCSATVVADQKEETEEYEDEEAENDLEDADKAEKDERASSSSDLAAYAGKKPHIIVVMIDDLGWSGVGFNLHEEQRKLSEDEKPHTPNIDEIASDGVHLKRHYSHKVCAPARASFLSGRLPGHVLQKNYDRTEPYGGVDPSFTTVADVLRSQGYATHHVGKWHAGMSSVDYIPTSRGFDSSLGFLSGSTSYFFENDEQALYFNYAPAKEYTPDTAEGADGCVPYVEADFRSGYELEHHCRIYSHDIYMKRALSVLDVHNAETPLFMFLALQLVHEPLTVPTRFYNMFTDKVYAPKRFGYAMVAQVDESMGYLHAKLKEREMWQNTLMLFTSDNGGAREYEANFPLRGGKGSWFEGGVRVASFVGGGLVPQDMRGKQLHGSIHICDWWGTFAYLAGHDGSDKKAEASFSIPAHVQKVDSYNMWPYLSGQAKESPRTEVYLGGEFSSKRNRTSAALIQGGMKLILGRIGESLIPGPTTPNETDDALLLNFSKRHPSRSREAYKEREGLDRSLSSASHGDHDVANPNDALRGKYVMCLDGCLYNLSADDEEVHDLAGESIYHKELATKMRNRIADLMEQNFESFRIEGRNDNELAMAKVNKTGYWVPWLDPIMAGVQLGVRILGEALSKSPVLGLPSTSDCEASCEGTAGCKGWSFHGLHGHVQSDENKCELYGSIGSATASGASLSAQNGKDVPLVPAAGIISGLVGDAQSLLRLPRNL